MLLTSLNVVKNFVLLGDVQHSVQFVHYRDEVGAWHGWNGWMTVLLLLLLLLLPLPLLLLLLQAVVAGQAVAEWHACLTNDAMRNLVPAGPPAVAAVQGLQPRRRRRHTVPDQWVCPCLPLLPLSLLFCCCRIVSVSFTVAFARRCMEARALEAARSPPLFCFFNSGTACPCRSSLHLASADSAGTLRLLSYAQNHPESWKGQRLVAW
jgi:hypothetical protein